MYLININNVIILFNFPAVVLNSLSTRYIIGADALECVDFSLWRGHQSDLLARGVSTFVFFQEPEYLRVVFGEKGRVKPLAVADIDVDVWDRQ